MGAVIDDGAKMMPFVVSELHYGVVCMCHGVVKPPKHAISNIQEISSDGVGVGT